MLCLWGEKNEESRYLTWTKGDRKVMYYKQPKIVHFVYEYQWTMLIGIYLGWNCAEYVHARTNTLLNMQSNRSLYDEPYLQTALHSLSWIPVTPSRYDDTIIEIYF